MARMARTERDALGEKEIPSDCLFGIHTLRAKENFPISGRTAPAELVRAIALIKSAAAEANTKLNIIPPEVGKAVMNAAEEIISGKHRDQFVVDIYQAGAGTSHNMNVNEVIANRAEEMLGGKRGEHKKVHPNDHVNRGQSTNDVIPTAMRLACLPLAQTLQQELQQFKQALHAKTAEFEDVIKTGRTHLQDAVPITLGQEFNAWASMIGKDILRLDQAAKILHYLPLGGTAVGTGINTPEEYAPLAIDILARKTGLPLQPAMDRVESTQSLTDFLALSGAIRCAATDVLKICNDIRLLSSGPDCGFRELRLPPVQAGSSIMPGKVNPAMPEMLSMVCYQVIGLDHTIALCAQGGQLELNVWMPLMIVDLIDMMILLRAGIETFRNKCLRGIEADRDICTRHFERSSAIATLIAPRLGYDKTALIVKEALKRQVPVRQVILEKKMLTPRDLDVIFDRDAVTRPNIRIGPAQEISQKKTAEKKQSAKKKKGRR